MNNEILKDMTEKCILGHETHNQLALQAKCGDLDAMEKLLSHNYRLINKLANRYKTPLYSEDDLFQDGVIGMMNALVTYDETKSSFTTHAFNWIRAEMLLKTTKNSSDFHYNSSFYDKIRKYERLVASTERTTFTADELTAYNLTETEVKTIRKYHHKDCYSLEMLSENGSSPHLDNNDCIFMADESVENIIIQKELRNILLAEINTRLKPLEKYVTINIFGLNGPSRKLTELADELHVSRQYISKIKAKSIEKLKQSDELINLFYESL